MQLAALVPGECTLDLIVVGCGPAGLGLAAEAAKKGLSVGLIGPDVPFVNNYGVWVDEFESKLLSSIHVSEWQGSTRGTLLGHH